MAPCREVMEREAPPRNALVGHLHYKDGSVIPAILLDVSQDPEKEFGFRRLYKDRKLFSHVTIHIDASSGLVTVESEKDLLDGTHLVLLQIRFVPETPEDDVAAFLGLMEITQTWVLVVRLSHIELHFVVHPDSDQILYRYASRHRSEIKRFDPP